MVITDCYSRWAEVYPLPDTSAQGVALALADWTSRFGAPLVLLSDRGSSFLNYVIPIFSRLWGFNQMFTAAYTPQSNGLVERFNATLEDMIRVYAMETGALWDETISAILFAYRTSFHSGVNTSPDMLVYGINLRLPLDQELDQLIHQQQLSPTSSTFIFRHAQALSRARNQARKHMERMKIDYEQRYNQLHRCVTYNVGDFVWFTNENRSNKLQPRWIGPYRIYEKPSANTYLIHDASGRPRPSPVSVQSLKPLIMDQSQLDQALLPSTSLFSSFPLLPIFSSSSSSISSSSSALLSSSSSANSSFSSSRNIQAFSPLPFSSINRSPSLFGPGPDTNNEFEVDIIIAERGRDAKGQPREYLVKWTGYADPTWTKANDLTNCADILADWKNSQRPLNALSQHTRERIRMQSRFSYPSTTLTATSHIDTSDPLIPSNLFASSTLPSHLDFPELHVSASSSSTSSSLSSITSSPSSIESSLPSTTSAPAYCTRSHGPVLDNAAQ